MERISAADSEPEVVADVIYEAATDGTRRLRYTAGHDAEEIIRHRKAVDDETFHGGVKVQYGMHPDARPALAVAS